MTPDADPVETLKALRNALLPLHRELIESERLVYERFAGAIPTAGTFLQLLAHDPWFEWLRPLSRVIAAIDAALADKKQPVTHPIAGELIREVRELFREDEPIGSFAKIYYEALQRDPHLPVAHGRLRGLLETI